MSDPSEKDREDALKADALKAYEAVQKETDRASGNAGPGQGDAEKTAANTANAAGGQAGTAAPASGDSDAPASEAAVGDEGAGEPAPASAEEISVESLMAAQEERISALQEDLARAKADHYNLDQEYAAYVKRSKAEIPTHREGGIAEVVEALMSVLDDVDLARQHGDLEGPFKSVAEKLEDTLENKFGVKRFGKAGEDFDPLFHQAIQMLPGDGGDEESHPVIVQVAQPGYLHAEKVLRPAIVLVGPKSALKNAEAAGAQAAARTQTENNEN